MKENGLSSEQLGNTFTVTGWTGNQHRRRGGRKQDSKRCSEYVGKKAKMKNVKWKLNLFDLGRSGQSQERLPLPASPGPNNKSENRN